MEALETGPGSRSLLAAAVIGSGATVVVGVFGVLRTKVLALELEPAGLGLYGQVLALLTALSAASGLGLGLGTTRVVAECRTRGDRAGLKSALEVSFALPLAAAFGLALALAAGSGLLAPLLFDSDRALLVVLAAVAVPMVALQGPLIHALQGFRDVAGTQASNLIFGAWLTVASVAGVLLAGLDGAVLALAVGNLGYAAALAWRLRGLVRQTGVSLALRAGLRLERLRQPLVRSMLAIGFASLFVGVVSTIADLGVRTLVLQDEGADAAGIFQALQVVSVQMLGVIVASVVFLSFTAITEAHTAGDVDGVRRSIDDTLRLALLLVLPAILVFGLFRGDLVPLLLSARFGAAVDLLPLQLTGDAFRTVAWALGAALVPIGKTRAWVWMTMLTVGVYVAAAAVLVPAFGLDGAIGAYLVQWVIAALGTVAVLSASGLLAVGALTVRALAWGAAMGALILVLPQPTWPVAGAIAAASTALLLAVATGRDERAALIGRVSVAVRVSRGGG